jgi:MinD superfamily P-loop ATPase
MVELVVISGKGGTGKTTVVGALASLANEKVLADCDVDAANLHLLLRPKIEEKIPYEGSELAQIEKSECLGCGKCAEACRFGAIVSEDGVYRVDPLSCEGCKVCLQVCPAGAVSLRPRLSGWVYVSRTAYGPLVHGELLPGEENTGKLVTAVKMRARAIAKDMGAKWLFVDGAPGIGCPVIASLSGANAVLIVTEPSLSALHDLKRAAELARHFQAKISVVINKADLAPNLVEKIEKEASEEGLPIIGHIPYDEAVIKAQALGRPVVEYDSGPAAQAIRSFWEKLAAWIEREKP